MKTTQSLNNLPPILATFHLGFYFIDFFFMNFSLFLQHYKKVFSHTNNLFFILNFDFSHYLTLSKIIFEPAKNRLFTFSYVFSQLAVSISFFKGFWRNLKHFRLLLSFLIDFSILIISKFM